MFPQIITRGIGPYGSDGYIITAGFLDSFTPPPSGPVEPLVYLNLYLNNPVNLTLCLGYIQDTSQ